MHNAAVRSLLIDLGTEIFPRERQTPEGFGAMQKADIEKWWPIIKAAGGKSRDFSCGSKTALPVVSRWSAYSVS
jgi:hypothetical protein